MHGSKPESDDQTDGPLEFIQNIVDNVREEFEGYLESEGKKNFLKILTKIFSILLSVKADSTEKNNQSSKIYCISNVENMVRTKLTRKRVVIRRWPPREPHEKFKIKTILSEQKVFEIKKNGQVIRRITACRKTRKFTDKWARTF